ncbi:MAG: nucleotidyltransferase domain-containing protein [Candidatus Aminicenantia bacterium]
MNKNQKILVATNSQKVLNFFLDYPGKEFVEREIREALGISKSGANYALRELIKTNFILMYKKGKIHLYSLNYKNPVVKQLKVLKTIIYIQPILKKLERLSSKVILFGSSSRGEDIEDSDMDLFVVTNNKKEKIEAQINKLKLKRKVQLVVRSELGEIELKDNDPTFYEQVQKGIILWQRE